MEGDKAVLESMAQRHCYEKTGDRNECSTAKKRTAKYKSNAVLLTGELSRPVREVADDLGRWSNL